jgi:hypothetical protein
MKHWEWRRGVPEREAKASAEQEERRRRMEEERAARLQQWDGGQSPQSGRW